MKRTILYFALLLSLAGMMLAQAPRAFAGAFRRAGGRSSVSARSNHGR